MPKHALPDRVTTYWLSECTGIHHGTIKRRTTELQRDTKGRFKRTTALEAVYRGTFKTVDGEFVSTPEAVRRLTIAKKAEIDLDMEIKRGQRIPIEDVREVSDKAFQAVAATLKANCGKVLSQEIINEMFSSLRAAGQKMIGQHGNGRSDLE